MVNDKLCFVSPSSHPSLKYRNFIVHACDLEIQILAMSLGVGQGTLE
jgi:hypothetical protein